MNRSDKVARLVRRSLAAISLMLPAVAHGQSVALPSNQAPGSAIGYGAVGSSFTAVDLTHPLPVGGKQEAAALVVANAPSAPVTLFGGDYVFAQACTAYGSISLQVRGPDGGTFQTLLNKTASDTSGGTAVSFGSNAVVQAAVSGTTGCNATLSRIP